jgi:hypothetical protein
VFFVQRSFLSALMPQKSAKHPIVAAKPAAQNLDRSIAGREDAVQASLYAGQVQGGGPS